MADAKKKLQLEDITGDNLLKFDPMTGRYVQDADKCKAVAAAIREALKPPPEN